MITQKYVQLKGEDQMLEERDQVIIDSWILVLNNYNLILLTKLMMKMLVMMGWIEMKIIS